MGAICASSAPICNHIHDRFDTWLDEFTWSGKAVESNHTRLDCSVWPDYHDELKRQLCVRWSRDRDQAATPWYGAAGVPIQTIRFNAHADRMPSAAYCAPKPA